MKNNKPENKTTNQQNDDRQAQLADLPVEKAQESDVRGGATGVRKAREILVRWESGDSGNDVYVWDPGTLTDSY